MLDSNVFTQMAKNAKKRLSKRSEFREKNKSVCLRAEKNYLASGELNFENQKEKQEFASKVQELYKNEVVLTPFKSLIDKRVFETLDEVKKQKYVLELSNKFIKTRDMIIEQEC